MGGKLLRLGLGVLATLLFGVLIWMVWPVVGTGKHDMADSAVAGLAIAGAVCLVGLVVLITAVFAWLRLTDRTQALALPDGSVRALIALILLSAFIVVPVYLYRSLCSETKTIDDVPAAQKNDVVAGLGRLYLFSVPSPGKADTFRIYYRDDENGARSDVAKEILTALITLVASVSSFYFGAGVTKSALGAGPGPQTPTIAGINPSAGPTGTSVNVEISGSGLELVNKASLVNGNTAVAATGVVSNADIVKCSFALPTTAGKLDVILTTSDGKTAKLRQGFEVQAGGVKTVAGAG